MTYHCPTELNSALQLISQHQSTVIAGGTDVFPAEKQGHTPETLFDVTRIDGFRDITQSARQIRIGAATTWTQIIQADLPPAFDALKSAAREVGSIQIQNSGTIAGNLCNASPAADGVPPLLCLNASVELESATRGARNLPLSEFIKGVRQTDRQSDELVTAITLPKPSINASSAFEKLGSRRYLVISIAMTAVQLELDEHGHMMDARVAIGACSPVAQRLPDLESHMNDQHPTDIQVTTEHLKPLNPIDDVRGSADYRLEVVAEQCQRAIRKAAKDDT